MASVRQHSGTRTKQANNPNLAGNNFMLSGLSRELARGPRESASRGALPQQPLQGDIASSPQMTSMPLNNINQALGSVKQNYRQVFGNGGTNSAPSAPPGAAGSGGVVQNKPHFQMPPGMPRPPAQMGGMQPPSGQPVPQQHQRPPNANPQPNLPPTGPLLTTNLIGLQPAMLQTGIQAGGVQTGGIQATKNQQPVPNVPNPKQHSPAPLFRSSMDFLPNARKSLPAGGLLRAPSLGAGERRLSGVGLGGVVPSSVAVGSPVGVGNAGVVNGVGRQLNVTMGSLPPGVQQIPPPPSDPNPDQSDKDRIAAKIEKLQDESHVVKQLLASLQSTVRDAQRHYDESNRTDPQPRGRQHPLTRASATPDGKVTSTSQHRTGSNSVPGPGSVPGNVGSSSGSGGDSSLSSVLQNALERFDGPARGSEKRPPTGVSSDRDRQGGGGGSSSSSSAVETMSTHSRDGRDRSGTASGLPPAAAKRERRSSRGRGSTGGSEKGVNDESSSVNENVSSSQRQPRPSSRTGPRNAARRANARSQERTRRDGRDGSLGARGSFEESLREDGPDRGVSSPVRSRRATTGGSSVSGVEASGGSRYGTPSGGQGQQAQTGGIGNSSGPEYRTQKRSYKATPTKTERDRQSEGGDNRGRDGIRDRGDRGDVRGQQSNVRVASMPPPEDETEGFGGTRPGRKRMPRRQSNLRQPQEFANAISALPPTIPPSTSVIVDDQPPISQPISYQEHIPSAPSGSGIIQPVQHSGINEHDFHQLRAENEHLKIELIKVKNELDANRRELDSNRLEAVGERKKLQHYIEENKELRDRNALLEDEVILLRGRLGTLGAASSSRETVENTQSLYDQNNNKQTLSVVAASPATVAATSPATVGPTSPATAMAQAAAAADEEADWLFVIQGIDELSNDGEEGAKRFSCFPRSGMDRASQIGIHVCSLSGNASTTSKNGKSKSSSTTPSQDDFLLAMQRNPARNISNTNGNNQQLSSPSQDNTWLSVVEKEGFVALYGVFDGVGPSGGELARLCKQKIAELVFGHDLILQEPETVLREAFAAVQQEICANVGLFSGDNSEVENGLSQCSAGLALVLNLRTGVGGVSPMPGAGGEGGWERWAVVGWIGDSRVVFISREDKHSYGAVALTKDHRLPTNKQELSRIEDEQLELKEVTIGHTNSNKHGNNDLQSLTEWRLCASDDEIGSATTRALGNLRTGMLPDAEVHSYRIRDGRDIMLLLGTRGMFATESSSSVVSSLFSEKDPFSDVALRSVCKEARGRNREVFGGKNGGGEVVCVNPDVTAISVALE